MAGPGVCKGMKVGHTLFSVRFKDKMIAQTFTITKKIAKHGKQAVIIVPTILQEQLSPGKLVEIRIEIKE